MENILLVCHPEFNRTGKSNEVNSSNVFQDPDFSSVADSSGTQACASASQTSRCENILLDADADIRITSENSSNDCEPLEDFVAEAQLENNSEIGSLSVEDLFDGLCNFEPFDDGNNLHSILSDHNYCAQSQ